MSWRFPAWALVVDGSILLLVGGYTLGAGHWSGALLSGVGLAVAAFGMLDQPAGTGAARVDESPGSLRR